MASENKVLVIDNDLRTIKLPAGMTNIGVAGDKEVTRLHFKMPRFYGGFDLGQFDISINYFNAAGGGDVYVVNDAWVYDELIMFSWLIDEYTTLYSGNVRFNVHLEKKSANIVEKEFNTAYAISRVLEGVNSIEQISETFPSIVNKWKEELFGKFNGRIDPTLKLSGMAADAAVTGTKIKKLEHAVSSPYNFKGSCTYDKLPSSAIVNDTYYCTDKKCRYTWNGTDWYQSSMNESDYEDALSAVENDTVRNYPIDGSIVNGYYVRPSDGKTPTNEDLKYIECSVIGGGKLVYRYTKGNSIQGLAFFDKNDVFISGVSGTSTEQTLTIPENAVKVKATVSDVHDILICRDINAIIAAIQENKFGVLELNNDLVKRTPYSRDIIPGYYVRVSDGGLAAHSAYKYIQFGVSPGSTVEYTHTVDEKMVGLAFYNSSDEFIKGYLGIKGTQIFVVPDDATWLRATVTSADAIKFGSDVSFVLDDIARIKSMVSTVTGVPELLLPSESIAVVGHEWNMYYDAVVNGLTDTYCVKCKCAGDMEAMDAHAFSDCLRFTPTIDAVGDHTVTISVVNKFTNAVVASKTFVLHVIGDVAVNNRKVVFIGDSLTDDGRYVAEVVSNLSNNGIVSVGTRGHAVTINDEQIDVMHEGYAGWSVTDFISSASDDDNKINAFWNPNTESFDFTYYMTSNGYTGVEAVSIYLGTNGDPTFEDTLSGLDEMIASIHSYDSNIKIVVCLLHMPATQDGCGNHNRLQSSNDLVHRNHRLNKMLLDHYETNDDIPNVYVAELNFNVDSRNDYDMVTQAMSARNPKTITVQNNNVHPSLYGYLKIADVIYNKLLYLLTN